MLHCARCDIAYAEAAPSAFSFNSPLGACETCRGFGRSIGIDYRLVVPDPALSLRQGAIKPWQTESFRECQQDMERYAKKRGVPLDVPWHDLADEQRDWVVEGEGEIDTGVWYGARRFFAWLESKSYKMHIRVLLSKYRSYDLCSACHGARLKPGALLWRIASAAEGGERGLDFHSFSKLPVSRALAFVEGLCLPAGDDEATAMVLAEIRSRLRFLVEVGVGYLALDRQSRTLSGGEVQRINLTTALGSSLVNTLFVLDEPSIGLHPRDVGRVVTVLERLRDAGNTLLVVEHDPQIMLAADRLIDMGPGPGKAGGDIVFHGPAREIGAVAGSLTGAYLRGERRVERVARRTVDPGGPCLELLGVSANNLKHIDVRFPLGALVCVTGVSGSGKSTLIGDVLYQGARQQLGRPLEVPGAHRELRGLAQLADVVFVDQSPIGKSARSNPASYVGAWGAIRNLFARTPLAVERGYTPGTFSFNAGDGRCPACTGSGFEHVEMQFLSDVYLRCPECDGKRFRPEVLEVRLEAGCSIAEVLAMTVSEAIAQFAAHREVIAMLAPLVDVGLDYLALGQPVPTLSGGEAQRLKLAGHLAEAGARRKGAKGALFVFDEPTTGLHFEDIARLLGAFDKLLAAGHSLLVIEHNLDVIDCADWLIELGPEGGEAGGELVFCGTPDAIVAVPGCHTGVALRRLPQGARTHAARASAAGRRRARPAATIEIHRAREHNLKDIDLAIPRDALHGDHRHQRQRQEHGGLRHPVRRGAAALPRVAERLRAPVRAAGGAARRRLDPRHSARGGRRAAHQPRRAQEHGGDADRDVPLPAPAVREAGHAVLPGLRHPDRRRRPPEVIVARVLREFRGQRVQRAGAAGGGAQGLLHRARESWAASEGTRTCAWTASWCRPSRGRGSTASRSTRSSCRWRSCDVKPRERARAARGARRGAGGRQRAWCRCCARRRARRQQLQVYSTRRACPRCERSFAELDPRLFSYNSAHGWCAALLRHGPAAGRASTPSRPARSTGGTTGGRGGSRPAAPAVASACDPRRWRCGFRDAASPTTPR